MTEQASSSKMLAITAIAIFAFAVFLRMPSCYESFWLDELHSAWVVWDGVDQVYSRSVIGHQSPVYFYLLWTWKQLCGTSEVMLRLSSVLPVAFSCGLLTFSVSRWSQSYIAGAVAGLLLALENNSLFFGTELRPYAWVILFSAIATDCFLRLWSTRYRHDEKGAWLMLVASLMGAALFQPTSLGVLMWLPCILWTKWAIIDPRACFRLTRTDGVCGIMVLLVGIVLWIVTLQDSWQQKSIWSAFGTAASIDQIARVWNWTWLWTVPLIGLAVGIIIRSLLTLPCDRKWIGSLLTIALLAVGTTCLYWFCSFMEFAPIWHRRYFVAALPLFASISGGSVGYLHQSLPNRPTGAALAAVIGTLLILGLGTQQRTFTRLHQYPVALVVRGEDWRGAVNEINRDSDAARQLFLDSGLIEARSWITPNLFQQEKKLHREYLEFPVRGPYRIEHSVIPVGSSLQPLHGTTAVANHDAQPVIILTRRPASLARKQLPQRGVKGFGGVSVVLPK